MLVAMRWAVLVVAVAIASCALADDASAAAAAKAGGDALEAKLQQMFAQFEAKTMARVAGDLAAIRAKADQALSESRNTENGLSSQVQLVKAELADFKKSSSKVNSNPGDLAALKKEVSANKKSIDALKARVKSLQKESDSWKRKFEDLKSATGTGNGSWAAWFDQHNTIARNYYDIVCAKSKEGWSAAKVHWNAFYEKYLTHVGPVASSSYATAVKWAEDLHKRWRPIGEGFVQNIHAAIRSTPSLHGHGIERFVTVEVLLAVFVVLLTVVLRVTLSLLFCCCRSSPKAKDSSADDLKKKVK
ncbi:unnamed protein product (mitochondrion) [Plasmodiophora brassicae]|uniref:Uncharacterized protein n=1 Tax=Plasmodiophora brassicae TaxID=37360 RepID=A0A0G4IMV1_PLABS|nr:hypothetical protein PBRA_005088 [Plasmodiophora brassicae]SPQ99356.1 unnamed protein product [Plasmodiophora brassicae]